MHALSKIGVGFPTFMGASYSKSYNRIGMYTLFRVGFHILLEGYDFIHYW